MSERLYLGYPCIRILPNMYRNVDVGDHRSSYYDPGGFAVIVTGPSHLGECPDCYAPIMEISRNIEKDELPKAICSSGHCLMDIAIVKRWDALTPTWPADYQLNESDSSDTEPRIASN